MKLSILVYIFIPIPYCMAPWPAISYLTVSRVGPCLDRKPTEVVFVSEMSLYKIKDEFSLSGEVYIAADINDGWTLKAMMQKCNDIRNLDTCDFYKTMPIVQDGCRESKESDVYDMFFQYVTPKMECPVRAGNYTITDFPFFTEGSDLTSAKSKISTSVFGYTYLLEGFTEDDDQLLCVESHLRLNYIRDYDWTGGDGRITGPTKPRSKQDDDADTRPDDTDTTGPDDADTGPDDADITGPDGYDDE